MATLVMLRNPQTGIVKKGYYGFSWTTFFFGGLPALCRADFLVGVLILIGSVLTFGIANIIAAFLYNKQYTTKLVEQGYQFADNDGNVALARAKLGITEVSPQALATQG
jgi:hypothetical protein